MAARNSWAVSDTGGVLTVEDVRLHVGALVTPGATNVKSRTGLRPGGSTAATQPGLVAAQTVPDKTVKINAFQAFQQTGRGAGTYVQCLDTNTNIDLLTAHPADPSLQRNDLIIAQQDDKFYADADNTWTVKQVVGIPSGTPVDPPVTGSTDYYTLARVRVTALATTITAAMIDDLRPPWAVGLGGVLPVKNSTDRGTLFAYDGFPIWRIDRQWTEVYSIAAGGWLVQGIAQCSTTSDLSAITTPLTNQLAMVAADHCLYRYNGSSWAKHFTGVQVLSAIGSSNPQVVTITEADLTGASITFTSTSAAFTAKIDAVFDVDSSSVLDTFQGRLQVDGVTQGKEAHMTAGGPRGMPGQSWLINFAASGSHTVKLRVLKTANNGTMNCYGPHSTITATIYDL